MSPCHFPWRILPHLNCWRLPLVAHLLQRESWLWLPHKILTRRHVAIAYHHQRQLRPPSASLSSSFSSSSFSACSSSSWPLGQPAGTERSHCIAPSSSEFKRAVICSSIPHSSSWIHGQGLQQALSVSSFVFIHLYLAHWACGLYVHDGAPIGGSWPCTWATYLMNNHVGPAPCRVRWTSRRYYITSGQLAYLYNFHYFIASMMPRSFHTLFTVFDFIPIELSYVHVNLLHTAMVLVQFSVLFQYSSICWW